VATTATAPLFVDALCTALRLRAGLSGVTIFSAPPGADVTPEAIVFVDCIDNIEWGAIGKTRQNTEYVWSAVIRVSKPGAGETIAKTARDRVYAILNELKDELRITPQQGVTNVYHGLVSRETLRQRMSDGDRLAWVELDIRVKGRVGT